MIVYPTGWNGRPDNIDEFSAMILAVVIQAGKHITYKQAAIQIDELVKWREDGQSNK
tara:strand:- start:223 stop:393 length:171 start_codon:yes stop_codon:yes gene_type:complete